MQLSELKKAAKIILIGFLVLVSPFCFLAFLLYAFNNSFEILLMLFGQPHEHISVIQMVTGCFPFLVILLIFLAVCYKIGDDFMPIFDSEEESK